MPAKHVFKTGVKWSGSKRGSLSSDGKLNIGVAPPPQFNGEKGYWSPEDLLLSSVNSCIMMTFLYYAEKKGIDLAGYESEIEGVLEKVDNHLMFSEISIKPRISLKSPDQADKAGRLMLFCEKNCFISNSLKSRIEIVPEIKGAAG